MAAVGSAAVLASAAGPAQASQAWWHLTTTAAPSQLPPGGQGKVLVQAINSGDAASNGEPITLTDQLPNGFSVENVSFYSTLTGSVDLGRGLCTSAPVACTFPAGLRPFEELRLVITVRAPAGFIAAPANEFEIAGGGVARATLRDPLTISGTPTHFGIEQFAIAPEIEGGAPDAQAGSHPFQITSTLALNKSVNQTGRHEQLEPTVPQMIKNVLVRLPPGLLGNPSATAQCSEEQFLHKTQHERVAVNSCPASSAVGVANVILDEPFHVGVGGAPAPIFNLVPSRGEPARFGFEVEDVQVRIDTAVRTGSDYGVTLTTPDISQAAALLSTTLTFWGVPNDSSHDAARGWACIFHEASCIPTNEPHATPFLTLPTACGQALEASAEGDSWAEPGTYSPPAGDVFPRGEDGLPLGLDGCGELPFTPSISTGTDTSRADTPTGLDVAIHQPQQGLVSPGLLAQSALKTSTVALPQGVLVNPSSANDLEACSLSEAGFEGFAGGAAQFSPDAIACGQASEVGVVEELRTPLLRDALKGAIYLAAPNANPFGSLISLYLVAEDPTSGVRVKLAGNVVLNPQTGQLSATFENTPQVPFEDLKLRFFGGSRAPLSTPSRCGSYTTAAWLTPWSGNPPATPSSSFAITSVPNGGPCANASPFAPSLAAGSSSIQAGRFTPFATTVSREDGNQNLAGVTLHLPPGLLGALSSVTPCREPQASQATCASESLIGHTSASVGLGPTPYSISGGRVFITGPYHGAPYGLSIAQPAKAGPFDLGSGPCDCIVVRAKIEIDPHTSALTVVSDPLPTILQGIPVQLKHVNVTVDRPGFTFNPTNCNQLAITATITSEQGATAPESVPFEVANCATLPFRPKLTVLTQAKTSKRNGASLHVKVTSGPGQANIGKVRVDLPKQLPSRLTTLQQACPDATFNANPASCPAGSVVGTATAVTPVLKSPLSGPAYLVSHAGAAFPDLVVVLQGEGITLDLVGNTDIKKGVTISTFNSVPDAPISTFDLVLPQGPHSALGAIANLCRTVLNMPTLITGQNGAVIRQTTRIAVSGCPRHKGKKTRSTKRGRAKRTTKANKG